MGIFCLLRGVFGVDAQAGRMGVTTRVLHCEARQYEAH